MKGREKGRHTHVPIRHISYFFSCKDSQVHYTARGEEQALEFSSRHSAETLRATSLFFTQRWAQACLLVQCNANSNLSLSVTPLETSLTNKSPKQVTIVLHFHILNSAQSLRTQKRLCVSLRSFCLLYCITDELKNKFPESCLFFFLFQTLK